MAIIATDTGNDFNYVPAPSGIHQAVCADVVDLGMLPQKNFKTGEIEQKHKIYITWQLADKMEDGRRFSVSKRYTLSLHENANLRKDLDKWKGKGGLPVEVAKKGFDLEKLINVNATLWIKHSEEDDKGKVYANIIDIEPAKKDLPKLTVSEDFVRKQDRPVKTIESTADQFVGRQGTSQPAPATKTASEAASTVKTQGSGFPDEPAGDDTFGTEDDNPFPD